MAVAGKVSRNISYMDMKMLAFGGKTEKEKRQSMWGCKVRIAASPNRSVANSCQHVGRSASKFRARTCQACWMGPAQAASAIFTAPASVQATAAAPVR